MYTKSGKTKGHILSLILAGTCCAAGTGEEVNDISRAYSVCGREVVVSEVDLDGRFALQIESDSAAEVFGIDDLRGLFSFCRWLCRQSSCDRESVAQFFLDVYLAEVEMQDLGDPRRPFVLALVDCTQEPSLRRCRDRGYCGDLVTLRKIGEARRATVHSFQLIFEDGIFESKAERRFIVTSDNRLLAEGTGEYVSFVQEYFSSMEKEDWLVDPKTNEP